MKTERHYFAVVDGNGRLLHRTISHFAQQARIEAHGYLPARVTPSWKECLKRGYRVVKVRVEEVR